MANFLKHNPKHTLFDRRGWLVERSKLDNLRKRESAAKEAVKKENEKNGITLECGPDIEQDDLNYDPDDPDQLLPETSFQINRG